MGKRKGSQRLFIAVGIVCTVLLAIALFPRERLLLDRATKIADVHQDWWPGTFAYRDYRWTSDTVLFAAWRSGGVQRPFLYDVGAHRTTPLSRLSERLHQKGEAEPDAWEISPDGQWLLWTVRHHKDVRAVRLDGTGYRVIPTPSLGETTLGIKPENLPTYTAATGYRTGPRADVIFSREDGFVVTFLGENASNRGNVTVEQVIKSNRGDRLAWVLCTTPTLPLANLIGSVLPHYADRRTSAEVWVSRLDGSEKREVGHILLGENGAGIEAPGTLRWLPSDNKLSFLYDWALYTVPVD